jgi:molecular chaperone GrpE
MSDQKNESVSPKEESLGGSENPLSPDLEAALRDAEAHAEGLDTDSVSQTKTQSNKESESDPEIDQVRAELETAQKTISDLREGMLRARADLENARRRFEREQKESQLYAGERVLKSLIPIVDDLDRTLEHIPEGLDEENSLVSGVNMVHRKFLQALESQGATSFSPLGEAFDPTTHEALMEAPSEDVEPGHIMQVFQRGWLLNERLLRPAKVIIAKSAV